jgi:hypothetical protein
MGMAEKSLFFQLKTENGRYAAVMNPSACREGFQRQA